MRCSTKTQHAPPTSTVAQKYNASGKFGGATLTYGGATFTQRRYFDTEALL